MDSRDSANHLDPSPASWSNLFRFVQNQSSIPTCISGNLPGRVTKYNSNPLLKFSWQWRGMIQLQPNTCSGPSSCLSKLPPKHRVNHLFPPASQKLNIFLSYLCKESEFLEVMTCLKRNVLIAIVLLLKDKTLPLTATSVMGSTQLHYSRHSPSQWPHPPISASPHISSTLAYA